MMNRRNFLGSILVASCAPAIVRASSLMRVAPMQRSPAGVLHPALDLYRLSGPSPDHAVDALRCMLVGYTQAGVELFRSSATEAGADVSAIVRRPGLLHAICRESGAGASIVVRDVGAFVTSMNTIVLESRPRQGIPSLP